MATELVINPRLAQYVVQTIGRLLATFAILQGTFIILGGRERWSGTAFATALLLPGAPPTWGALLLTCGVIALAASVLCWPHVVAFANYCASAWSVFFALTFSITALQDETAATTGIWAYAMIAIMYALIGAAYQHSRRIEKDALHCNHP